MPLNNGQATSNVSLLNAFKALQDCINYNMNCVKVATVLAFDSEKMTVKCKVNNKRLIGLNDDGNQKLQEYPVIYAKVHFFGWGNIGSVYPIEPGMEGILLFNDRELETWFTTSESGNLAYNRCHDLTDALFICGVHSAPKIPLIPFIEECLHIYYKGSDIQIKDESITTNTKDNTLNAETSITENTKAYTINSSLSYNLTTATQTETASSVRNITTPTTNHNGIINSTELNDLTAATGYITDISGHKLAYVVNGIVRIIY